MVTPEGRHAHAQIFQRIAQGKANRDATLSLRNRRQEKQGRRFDDWPIQESTYKDYDDTFKGLLSNSLFKGSLLNFIQDRDNPTLVDLFSFPTALRSLFIPLKNTDVNIQTRGVSSALTDPRDDNAKTSDEYLGITHIAGDLAKTKTWNEIKSALGDKKADLIVERALGGLNYIPHDRTFFLLAMQNIWNTLSNVGGTALIDYSYIRPIFKPMEVGEWCNMLQREGVDAEWHKTKYTGAFRLTKHDNSPSVLPRLHTA